MTIDRNAIADDVPLHRTDGVMVTEVEGALLMLNLAQGQYHELNEVGARIWALLERPLSPAGLVAALVREYEVPEEDCAAAVRTFAAQLVRRGLLTAGRPD